jgi:hypothetical protein
LTRRTVRATLVLMAPKPPDDRTDELPPAEAARARRRDHDASAAGRSGMRAGLAKQFKQVLDTQAKRGRAAGAAGTAQAAGADDDDSPPPNGPPVPRRRRRNGDPEHT